jgi:Response regulator containing CheY-like receiver domain and AraC-type DNA-binding domain
MIKVMLVDDEPLIREGLKIILDWAAYGYEIVAEATNGMEALAIVKEEEIDLMIVDLNMPKMLGLELIKQIRNEIPQSAIQFIILSGLAEFEDAKTAMSLNVYAYLLKPIQKQELIELLIKMNRDYSQKQQHAKKEEKRLRIECRFRAGKVLLNKYTKEDIAYLKEYLCMGGEYWYYVSFEFDENEESFMRLNNHEKASLQEECVEYLKKQFKRNVFHIVPTMEREEYIFGVGVLYTPELLVCAGNDGRDYIACVYKNLCEHFGYKMRAYIGLKVDNLEEISKSFQEIRVLRCFYNIGAQKNSIVFGEQMKNRNSFYGISKKEVKALVEQIRNNDIKRISDTVEAIYAQMRNHASTIDMVKANIYYLYYQLLELVQEIGEEQEQMEVLQYITRESFDKLILSGNENDLKKFIISYAEYLGELKGKARKGILSQVKTYVEENYMENLNLKILGEKFYINNVYLGQLFKKNVGVSFNEYLNILRIEGATRLLETTDLRIYTIAEKSGFQNADYFINKFVGVKGITPNQYRMKRRK